MADDADVDVGTVDFFERRLARRRRPRPEVLLHPDEPDRLYLSRGLFDRLTLGDEIDPGGADEYPQWFHR